MHLAPVDAENSFRQANPATVRNKLDFLWLELTNRCNLQCIHCYTDSHPNSGHRDRLTVRDYDSVMVQAFALGCRKIQFIGGEPQLNPDFATLLRRTKEIGFEFVEVFSNLTRLDDGTVRFAADNGICFATSVYSDEPAEHDSITKVGSSHARTVKNLKKLIDAEIETRAAIIIINQGKGVIDRTRRFLKNLGVRHVRASEIREFGRGEEIVLRQAQMSGLCGHCWAGKLCIAPDGVAYPCVMAREWPVGNVLERRLSEIIEGSLLEEMRQSIFDTVWLPKIAAATSASGRENSGLAPSALEYSPNGLTRGSGFPDVQQAGTRTKPEECPQSCEPDNCPQSCEPTGTCLPSACAVCPPAAPLEDPFVIRECDPCPQSCTPIDESTCAPLACPQCCDPNRVE